MVSWKKVGLCAWAFLVLVAMVAMVFLAYEGEYLLSAGVLAAIVADFPAAKRLLEIFSNE